MEDKYYRTSQIYRNLYRNLVATQLYSITMRLAKLAVYTSSRESWASMIQYLEQIATEIARLTHRHSVGVAVSYNWDFLIAYNFVQQWLLF